MSADGKTVLLAWELGEGLGHLPPLKAIARALQQEGAKVAFALRDPALARASLAEFDADVLQAPSWATPAWPAAPSGTYADVLIANGYGTAAGIRGQVQAWDRILDRIKPDLVVCEHAPTAALAAFGRMPVAFVGNGFVVPPADNADFPAYEAGAAARAQPALLQAVQEALSGLGRTAPTTLCEPFGGVFRGVYTFPELDTYRHVRGEPVMGPIEPMPPLTAPPAQQKLFAYSATDYPQMDQLVQGLMDLGARASVYFRGAPGARAAVLRSRGVVVWDTAPPLATVLPEASVVFSHGGTGFTNAAFAAGRTHIVAPRHLEAQITGRRLEEIGAGVSIDMFDVPRFREALNRAGDAKMREAAQKAGAAAQAFLKTASPLDTTMSALRAILG